MGLVTTLFPHTSKLNACLFWLEKQLAVNLLKRDNGVHLRFMGGRHGFDVVVEAEVACRGCLVGLAKNPGKTLSADTELALAA